MCWCPNEPNQTISATCRVKNSCPAPWLLSLLCRGWLGVMWSHHVRGVTSGIGVEHKQGSAPSTLPAAIFVVREDTALSGLCSISTWIYKKSNIFPLTASFKTPDNHTGCVVEKSEEKRKSRWSHCKREISTMTQKKIWIAAIRWMWKLRKMDYRSSYTHF